MAMTSRKFKTPYEYFSSLAGEKKTLLQELRSIISKAAPEAEEIISYNMPAYRYHGMLVYFMAHKTHIGFYPGNRAVNEIFKDELKTYKTSKGTIQFPLDKPLPKRLITKIVKFRLNENLDKSKFKRK
ncbi:MAG TPA: DUF1801 domain-containing protein [Ignavibacteriaceae bacterium]|jgi:uncharacterized protein YdhG (YjbR/CyaY superfamily)|nr:DUF1801 domain-containing protein [Ignavibacteriaceae bacterium]